MSEDLMISCAVCNKKFHSLSNSHLRMHGLNFNDYKSMYPDAPIMSDTHKQILSERSKITNLSRVGVARTDEVKQKISNKTKGRTAHNKGVAMTDDAKQHLSELRTEKYQTGEWTHWNTGNITPDDTKAKIKATLKGIKSHLVTDDQHSLLSNKETLVDLHHDQQLHVLQIAQLIGVDPLTIVRRLNDHNIERRYYNHSAGCAELIQFLQDLGINVTTNNRSLIKPYEIDIFLPDYNIGIEYNGIYWHSELAGRDKDYHLNKLQLCNVEGIRLIQIWENEWLQQPHIVKSRIKSMLGINKRVFARKCVVVKLTAKQSREFLTSAHIQGHVNGSHYLGLQYDGEIVALMSFGQSRFEKNTIELLRYANMLNTNVIGGASKLFKYFIRNYNPTQVVSYSDKRWNTGKLYKQLGFNYVSDSKPNYFYFKGGLQLLSRIQFQKHKLKDKLDFFDPKLTEWENMVSNGYNRIWDCGNSKWVFISE